MIPLIVILGPTSSGKSDLAIRLAKKFNGEIVSADSRQVYKGLDIGTGKVTKREQKMVPHHLLDVARPGVRFTLARYKKGADAAIKDIWKRGKLPLLVGGSALYIKAVVEGYRVPAVRPNLKLRADLEAQPLANLLKLLKQFDQKTYRRIDKKNTRRVIRALEIIYETGKPIPALTKEHPYDALMIGLNIARDKLYSLINARVDARAQKGMIREVERLIEQGVSKKWLKNLGLEYRYITEYVEIKPSLVTRHSLLVARASMLARLKCAIHDFARRQLVWWRKEGHIHWISDYAQPEKLVRKFMNEKKHEQ
ncbi:tRNA (adenosine(37)-N6)-dimethylallyltransferase MiaA [Candidatus Uhrbacteria bacterium]|nr:tRNA (adenosine(37)-N6)-dimethylallyltransferase MiaA [Candidatus Uhrbacteria bacterium]